MSHVVWSARSLRDLERLYNFLLPERPITALVAVEKIRLEVDKLWAFPALGKRVEGSEVREFTVTFGRAAYMVLYRSDVYPVRILSVRHSREQSY